MQKFIVSLFAIASSLGLFAEGLDPSPHLSGANFQNENFRVGEEFFTRHDDTNGAPESAGTPSFWITNDEDDFEGTISSYMKGEEEIKYLDFESNITNPVYRTIKDCYNADSISEATPTNIGKGLFMDTRVKFTPYTVTDVHTPPIGLEGADNYDTQDKLVIWLREQEVVSEENDVTVTNMVTNLVATAAYFEGTDNARTIKHYELVLPNDITYSSLVTDFHRLTIKAFKNITTSEAQLDRQAGFVVYLDGDTHPEPLEYVDAASQIAKERCGAGVPGSAVSKLTDTIKNRYYTETKKCLLPCLIPGDGQQSISAVGFSGTGAVSEIYFDDYSTGFPKFAMDPFVFDLCWTKGVTGFEFSTDNGKSWETISGLSGDTIGFTNLSVNPSLEGLKICNVTYLDDDKYKAGVDVWFDNKGNYYKTSTDGKSGTFDLNEQAASYTIAAFERNYAVDVGGVVTEFQTLFGNGAEDGAIEFAKTEKGWLKLGKDVEIDEGNSDGLKQIKINGGETLKLDLAGYTIKGTLKGRPTIDNYGILEITNSTTKLGIVLDGDPDTTGDAYAIGLNDGSVTTIFGGQFDKFKFQEPIEDEEIDIKLKLDGGKYFAWGYNPHPDDPDQEPTYFYLNDYVEDNVAIHTSVESDKHYYTVAPGVVATIGKTDEIDGIASVVVTQGLDAVTSESEDYTVASGLDFTVTYKAKDHYLFGNDTDTTNATYNITAPATYTAPKTHADLVALTLKYDETEVEPTVKQDGETKSGTKSGTNMVYQVLNGVEFEITWTALDNYIFESNNAKTFVQTNTLDDVGSIDAPAVKMGVLTVTFDKKGHGTDTAAQKVNYGECATKPDDPTDDANNFGGWYENGELTGAEFDFDTAITNNLTLYAKWTIKSYTVTYTNGTEQIGSETVNHDAKPQHIPEIPAKTGYAFAGWSPSDPTNAVITCATNFVTTYTAIPYAITYAYGEGMDPATANPTDYTIEGAVFTLNEPTPATGYHFTEWSTDKSGVTFNGNEMTIAAGTIEPFTVTANYAINTYTVTFKPENGGANIVSNNVPYGTAFADVEPKNLEKTGYTFAGWTPEGAQVTANAEYTAQWTAIDYDITYAYGDGTGPTPANTATYQISDAEQTITLSVPTPKAGFHFTNWTVATKDGVSIDGNTLKIAAGTIEAIAVTANYAANVYFPQSDIEDQYKDRDGTEALPFVIRKYEDLVALQEMVAVGQTTAGVYFEQVADIDFTGKDPWAGIGQAKKDPRFCGTYDGAGKKVTNITLDGNVEYAALFGQIGDGAVVKNISEVNIAGVANYKDDTCVGGLVGYAEGTVTVSDIKVTGTIGTTEQPMKDNVSGLICRADNKATKDSGNPSVFTRLEFAGTINAASASLNRKVAGILGYAVGKVVLDQCVCSGTLVDNATVDFTYAQGPQGGVGGLVGYIWSDAVGLTFKDCVMKGTIVANQNVMPGAGLYGASIGVTITFEGTNKIAKASFDGDVKKFNGNSNSWPKSYAVENAEDASLLDMVDALKADETFYTIKTGLTPTYQFTDVGTIAFNTNLFEAAAFNVTVNDDVKLALSDSAAAGVVTFTAVKHPYVITFNKDEGVLKSKLDVVYGDVLTADKIPNVSADKEGHTFTGWSPSDPTNATVTGDATYTAQWTINQYEVTYTVDGQAKDPEMVEHGGTPQNIPAIADKKGYSFTGWSPSDPTNAVITCATNFVTTYAKIPYAITYDYGAGVGPATSNQETYVISTEAQTIHLTAPTPALGYDFTGFAMKETREGVTFNDKTNMVIEAGQIDPISVKANYQVITYTISYEMDGGKKPSGSPTSYTVNDSITVGNEATKDGHNFTGWTWEGQSTPKKNVTIPVGHVGNITFTAHWEIREFVQEFIKNIDADVSNLPAKTNVAWHTKLIKPATDPSCVGYRFDGWYKDEHCTEAFDFNQLIEAAHFIYAKWVKTFTVTLEKGEGIDKISVDGADYTSGTELVKDTNTVVNVTATVLEGYNEFAGASYTIVCDTNVTLATTLKVYEVTFADGANSKITPAAGTSNIVHGTQVTVTATADENYEFAAESYAGWTKQSDGTLTTNVTVTAAATFTAPVATATPVEITIPAADKLPAGVTDLKIYQSSDNGATWSLVENGKIVVGNQWKVEGTAADGYTVKNPIASGTAQLGKAISVTEAQIKSAVAYTVTVPQLVNFTVAVTNGETEVGTTNGVYTFNYASNVKVVFAAAEGYQITADTSTNIVSLVDNVVITAPTVEIKKYTVKFMSDGAEYAVSNNVPHFTAFANVKPADPEKTGYTFAGWDPEGAMVTGDAIYTAKWTINKFTVTFVQGLNKETTNTVADVEYDSKVAAENIPAITAIAGYTAAWDEDPTNTAITAAKTFTAQYTYIEYALTLTGGANVTTNVEPANATYHYGDAVTVTATPNQYYTFEGVTLGEGWGLNEGGAATNTVTITGDTTVAIPSAAEAPVEITVPAELPTGVAGLTIYQSADGNAWTKVTDGRIVVGNQWKVEGTAADGYTVQNPVKFGSAELGKAISVSKEDVAAKVTINTYTVTVPELVNFTVAVTNGETEVGTTNGVYTFNYASNVKVAFAAETGYQITADTSTNIVSLVENVEIAAPTVEKIKFNITFTDAAAWTNVVETEYGEVPVAPEAPVVTGKSFKEWNPTIVAAVEEATYTAVYTNNQYTLTIPAVDHASAVVSNATDEVSERVFDYGTQVTVYWTAEAGWKITSGATQAITMNDNVTAATPTVEKAEITITVKKGDGIASVTYNEEALVFNDNVATLSLPADTTAVTLTLAAVDTIKIPVFTYAKGVDVLGWNTTSKETSYDVTADDTLNFAAEEANAQDPAITDAVAAEAVTKAATTEEGKAKVAALTTGEGAVGGKELATWIIAKASGNVDAALAGDYVKASVKLDVAPITETTAVKVETVEKQTSDLAVTVKIGEADATKEQIESFVELCGDLGAANDWEKLPKSTLKSAVKIEAGKLVITPQEGISKLFLKVVIPADVK